MLLLISTSVPLKVCTVSQVDQVEGVLPRLVRAAPDPAGVQWGAGGPKTEWRGLRGLPVGWLNPCKPAGGPHPEIQTQQLLGPESLTGSQALLLSRASHPPTATHTCPSSPPALTAGTPHSSVSPSLSHAYQIRRHISSRVSITAAKGAGQGLGADFHVPPKAQ